MANLTFNVNVAGVAGHSFSYQCSDTNENILNKACMAIAEVIHPVEIQLRAEEALELKSYFQQNFAGVLGHSPISPSDYVRWDSCHVISVYHS